MIEGETGCGKTTQVPQYILDHYAAQGRYCNIVVTQPRRIAAISIARRVCAERQWHLGRICGYQVLSVAVSLSLSLFCNSLHCLTDTGVREPVRDISALRSWSQVGPVWLLCQGTGTAAGWTASCLARDWGQKSDLAPLNIGLATAYRQAQNRNSGACRNGTVEQRTSHTVTMMTMMRSWSVDQERTRFGSVIGLSALSKGHPFCKRPVPIIPKVLFQGSVPAWSGCLNGKSICTVYVCTVYVSPHAVFSTKV